MTVTTTTITAASTRAEVVEALGHANAAAKRCPARDHLSRPSVEWAGYHRFINGLLDTLERMP